MEEKEQKQCSKILGSKWCFVASGFCVKPPTKLAGKDPQIPHRQGKNMIFFIPILEEVFSKMPIHGETAQVKNWERVSFQLDSRRSGDSHVCRKCADDCRDSIFGYGKRGSQQGAWMRNVRGWYIKMKQLERDYETNSPYLSGGFKTFVFLHRSSGERI